MRPTTTSPTAPSPGPVDAVVSQGHGPRVRCARRGACVSMHEVLRVPGWVSAATGPPSVEAVAVPSASHDPPAPDPTPIERAPHRSRKLIPTRIVRAFGHSDRRPATADGRQKGRTKKTNPCPAGFIRQRSINFWVSPCLRLARSPRRGRCGSGGRGPVWYGRDHAFLLVVDSAAPVPVS